MRAKSYGRVLSHKKTPIGHPALGGVEKLHHGTVATQKPIGHLALTDAGELRQVTFNATLNYSS